MATALDLVTDAYFELGVLGAADVLSGEDSTYGLTKLNRLLDNWNADRRAVFADVFSTFTLTPNLSPHTIGPSGTFTLTLRPVSIDGADLVDNTVSPAVHAPLKIRDAAWWAANSLPALTSSWPTDLYYDPTATNGSLYFWPVPTTAYQVELRTRVLLATMTLSTTFTLPQGYQDAITLTLAEDLSGPLRVPVPPLLPQKAREARARIFANNDAIPTIQTRDAGVPTGPRGGAFNWITRQMV